MHIEMYYLVVEPQVLSSLKYVTKNIAASFGDRLRLSVYVVNQVLGLHARSCWSLCRHAGYNEYLKYLYLERTVI